MKKFFVLLTVSVLFLFVMPACSKSSGGGGGGTPEATLAVTLNPANGSTQAPAPGPDFPLNVSITSTMPPSGVKIDISANVDGSSNPAFFTKSGNSSTSSNDFTITSTPKTVVCLVNVTVTSLSTSSNKWTGSYRYSMK